MCRRPVDAGSVGFAYCKACSMPEEVARGFEYRKACSRPAELVLTTAQRVRGLWRFGESVLTIAKCVGGL